MNDHLSTLLCSTAPETLLCSTAPEPAPTLQITSTLSSPGTPLKTFHWLITSSTLSLFLYSWLELILLSSGTGWISLGGVSLQGRVHSSREFLSNWLRWWSCYRQMEVALFLGVVILGRDVVTWLSLLWWRHGLGTLFFIRADWMSCLWRGGE